MDHGDPPDVHTRDPRHKIIVTGRQSVYHHMYTVYIVLSAFIIPSACHFNVHVTVMKKNETVSQFSEVLTYMPAVSAK